MEENQSVFSSRTTRSDGASLIAKLAVVGLIALAGIFLFSLFKPTQQNPVESPLSEHALISMARDLHNEVYAFAERYTPAPFRVDMQELIGDFLPPDRDHDIFNYSSNLRERVLDLTDVVEIITEKSDPAARDLQSLYFKSLAFFELLTEIQPENTTYNNDLYEAHQTVALVAWKANNLKVSSKHAATALQLATKLSLQDQMGIEQIQQQHSMYSQLAEYEETQGDVVTARSFHKANIEALKAISSMEPDNEDALYNLSLGYLEAGQLEGYQTGVLASPLLGRDYFVAGLDIISSLVEIDSKYEPELAQFYLGTGSAELQLNNHENANAYFETLLHLELKEADQSRPYPGIRLSEGVAYTKLGNVAKRAGNFEVALHYYDNALVIHQDFYDSMVSHRAQPSKPLHMEIRGLHLLGTSEFKVGGALYFNGDFQEAHSNFQRFLKLAQERLEVAQIYEEKDQADGAQRSISLALLWLGNTTMQLGDFYEAKSLFDSGLVNAQALIKIYPNNGAANKDVIKMYEGLGNSSLELGDSASAKAYLSKALDHIQHMMSNRLITEQNAAELTDRISSVLSST